LPRDLIESATRSTCATANAASPLHNSADSACPLQQWLQ
jgi:hypothetical protein